MALTVGVALVAVLAAGLVAGCSAIIEKKLGDGVCGDGVKGPDEQCDDLDFGNQDCTIYNGPSATGHLVCNGFCRIDSQYCLGGEDCGNGICEPGEFEYGCSADCRDANCGDGYCQVWEDVDFCSQDCGGPIVCGNGVREHGEDCDGGDFGGTTCQGLGFDAGDLTCAGDCMIIVVGCGGVGVCGDDVAGPDEDCDGEDLRSLTCMDFGYEYGSLGCHSSCRFDDYGCVPFGGGLDGDPCVNAGDCMGSECLYLPNPPNSDNTYCSHVCQFGICPGGGICIEGPGGEAPLCYSGCGDPATDCQGGFECLEVVGDFTDSICWPPPSPS